MSLLHFARVEWDAVSGVSGVVSGAIAVVTLFLMFRQEKTHPGGTANAQAMVVLQYLLFSSGWVLLVLAYNWIVAPFGDYLFPKDERKLYGIMISAPALLLTRYAFISLHRPTRRPKP